MKRSELRKIIKEEYHSLTEADKPLEKVTLDLGKNVLLKLKSQFEPVLKEAKKKGLITNYSTKLTPLSQKNSFGNGNELSFGINEKDFKSLYSKYSSNEGTDESFIYESLFYLRRLLVVTGPFFDNNIERGVGGELTLIDFRTPQELKKIRSGRPSGKTLKIKSKEEINTALDKYYKKVSNKIKILGQGVKNL